MEKLVEEIDLTFQDRWLNLADERLGTQVLEASDDFFAEKENLIKPGRGIYIPDKYTDRGKWMDGWESRRRRTPGHDFCMIKLGAAGIIHGVDIDTNHFLGNHPPYASMDACDAEGNGGEAQWHEILPKVPLKPGSQNLFEVSSEGRWSHVRLNIFPDGGVARLRVYGEPVVDWQEFARRGADDLLAAVHQGKALVCNDMFFSSIHNLIMPGRGRNMGDGWETKRRRTPGHDWVILKLGHPGRIEKMIVDTAHFKGNYPDRCSVDGIYLEDDRDDTFDQELEWQLIMPEQKLGPDAIHEFTNILAHEKLSHLRFNIFPDGGVSRLRAIGKIV